MRTATVLCFAVFAAPSIGSAQICTEQIEPLDPAQPWAHFVLEGNTLVANSDPQPDEPVVVFERIGGVWSHSVAFPASDSSSIYTPSLDGETIPRALGPSHTPPTSPRSIRR